MLDCSMCLFRSAASTASFRYARCSYSALDAEAPHYNCMALCDQMVHVTCHGSRICKLIFDITAPFSPAEARSSDGPTYILRGPPSPNNENL